jgi:hypothetical protein
MGLYKGGTGETSKDEPEPEFWFNSINMPATSKSAARNYINYVKYSMLFTLNRLKLLTTCLRRHRFGIIFEISAFSLEIFVIKLDGRFGIFWNE